METCLVQAGVWMPGSEAGHLHTVLASLPAGSAISIPATAGTSTSWSLVTSSTGTSGGPSSHKCRLCVACVTGSGTVRAASQCWPLSPPNESMLPFSLSSHPFLRLSVPVFLMQIKVSKARISPGSVNRCVPEVPRSLLSCDFLSLNYNNIREHCQVLYTHSLSTSFGLLSEASVIIIPI